MLERRRSRSGLRAVALSFASVLTTPAAWVVGRALARRSAPRALGHAHAALQQPLEPRASTSALLRARRAHEDARRSGCPVVLLPDVASASGLEELAALFEALRVERPTAAYDLPVGLAASLEHRDYVDAVEGVLAEAHARYEQPVDVVAVGLTCELVAVAASRVPEHVHSLVMVTPEGFGEPILPGFVERTARLAARRALRTPGLGAVLHRAWSGHVHPGVPSGAGHANHDPGHDIDGDDDGRARAIARATCRAERRGTVEDLYDTLVAPTMFLTGGGSLEADLRMRVLARRSQLFRAQSIEGTRDRPQVDDPKACADAVLAFHRSLTVRPKLRLLRGGRTGAPAAPRAHLHLATVHHG